MLQTLLEHASPSRDPLRATLSCSQQYLFYKSLFNYSALIFYIKLPYHIHIYPVNFQYYLYLRALNLPNFIINLSPFYAIRFNNLLFDLSTVYSTNTIFRVILYYLSHIISLYDTSLCNLTPKLSKSPK